MLADEFPPYCPLPKHFWLRRRVTGRRNRHFDGVIESLPEVWETSGRLFMAFGLMSEFRNGYNNFSWYTFMQFVSLK